MYTNKLKKFAQDARTLLIAQVAGGLDVVGNDQAGGAGEFLSLLP